eukprot:Gregarina_sp_Poly_1__11209@NODE_91_length_14868_cov_482_446186_g78_i0_p5_GENE_NODE_91_length_14868_cov_482_446186_g78_i0NODE_91_length_14868_cov_482_446186_g78_i0_p5_ORF_typecomplete_len491_score49_81Integrin_beta/PF00362_18/4_8e05Integrin_beta/PF00362_18/12stn_TNFRSF12A/PF12191_8/0_022_NODE_91_length_14868_cov_482_446186_g78_i067938265
MNKRLVFVACVGSAASGTEPPCGSDVSKVWESLQIYYLHNNKFDLLDYLDILRDFDLASKFSCLFQEVSTSFSTFTDKPLPFLGYGFYGNYQHHKPDYCLREHAPLSSNITDVLQATADIETTQDSHELSPAEGVSDALIRLLQAVQFDNPQGLPAEDYDAETVHNAVRIAIVVTNTWDHEHGEAKEAIAKWNDLRHYSAKTAFSWGGFGSDLFDGINLETSQDMLDWFSLASAFRSGDSNSSNPIVSATLLEKFGPFPYPVIQKDSKGDCDLSEYPSINELRGEIIRRENLHLIIAVSEPKDTAGLSAKCSDLDDDRLTCLIKYYKAYISQLGVKGSVIPLHSTNSTRSSITDAVSSILESYAGTFRSSDLFLRRTQISTQPGASLSTRNHEHKTSNGTAFATSVAAASGALVTSLLGGLLIWQRCGDEEECLTDAGSIDGEVEEETEPISRADRAVLAFQGYPIDDFSSVEPLDTTPRTGQSLADRFF